MQKINERQSSRYRSAAIALDFYYNDPEKLFAHAGRLVPVDSIHLLHIVRLDQCHDHRSFDPSCLEQEYWRCDKQLKDTGAALRIPEDRQALMIGSATNQISDYVKREQLDLLILGAIEEHQSDLYPIDVISGALHSVNTDLLIIR